MSDSDSAVHVLAQVAARLAKIESAARAVVVEDAASASGEQGIRRAIAELADALNNGDVAALPAAPGSEFVAGKKP